MNKPTPCSYLDSLNVNKMRFGLKIVRDLLSRLDQPQKSYKTIIIAGTNGKGSTAAMTASILRSAGYRVGLYTSPHLVDVRERIVVNGEKISFQDLNRMIEQVKKKVVLPVTYFEFLTAVAFIYFKNEKIDVAVLEVGLGGRLDATNVSTPLVSVITNIDFDHTAYLGDTLASITREKAGVVKRNGVCVTGVKQKKVLTLLENICRQRGAKLYLLGRDIKIRKQKDGLLTYSGVYRTIKNLTVPLKGEHQRSNAALALAAIEFCDNKGFHVGDREINNGLAQTRWAARLEIVQQEPLFILDGAHNPAGMAALCRALKKDFSNRRRIIVFSALADKDYRRMLLKLLPLAHKIILTQLKTERTMPVDSLGETVREMGFAPVVTGSVYEAVKKALTMARKGDLICATGSFYLAGEIKQLFHKNTFYANNKSVRKTR